MLKAMYTRAHRRDFVCLGWYWNVSRCPAAEAMACAQRETEINPLFPAGLIVVPLSYKSVDQVQVIWRGPASHRGRPAP